MRDQAASAIGHYGIAMLLGLAVVGCYVAAVAPIAYLFSDPDTSYFLEAARNAMSGNGLMVSTGLERWSLGTEPLSLWPPGFPLMIAVLAKITGLDPLWLAPRIVWLSWALVPAALLFTLRPVLSCWSIHLVSLLVLLAPGALANGWQAMSDLPFLLLIILSFGLLFRGGGNPARPHLLVLSGFACGLAYAVRNVGMAAFAAVIGIYGVMALLRLISLQAAVVRLAWWAMGAGLVVAPLLIRNLSVFGSLQPYEMPPSTIGIVTNIRYYAAAWLNDVFAVPGLRYSALWNDAMLLAPAIVIAAFAVLARKRLLQVACGLGPQAGVMFAMLFAYALAGTMIVIAARSRYEWGEFIGPRHILQYGWVFFAAAALLFERWGKMPRLIPTALALALVGIVGLRVYYAANDVAQRRQDFAIASRTSDPVALTEISVSHRYFLAMKLTISRDRELIQALRDLPRDTVLLSNYEDVLRVASGRVVHPIVLKADCDLAAQLDGLARDRRPAQDVLVLLFVERDPVQSGCWAALATARAAAPGFTLQRPYLLSFSADGLAAALRQASRR